jgi:hypothetical protein
MRQYGTVWVQEANLVPKRQIWAMVGAVHSEHKKQTRDCHFGL